MVDYAYVKIWDMTVGVIRWDAENNIADFQYDKAFLNKNIELSPLKMPINNGDRIYRFTDLVPNKNSTTDTFKGISGLLADSLPDRYASQLIDLWLAQNGRAPNSMNPVELLSFIGQRGMGALEFEPSMMKVYKYTFSVDVDSLVQIAGMMLNKKKEFHTDLNKGNQKAMKDLLKIGTSAGGARPKAVIAYNETTEEIRSGQTNVPKGFEHWLLKLDGVSDAQFGESSGWGRVEYAYYLMAKECGIEMTDCKLLEENGRAHFMTKRFDRENNIKHHIQTLCAIQHYDYTNLYSYSYEQVFMTMRMLRLTYPEAEQMFRRMVFNVLATNYDDHTKNFSFRLKKEGKWELSPAYDVCYAYRSSSQWVSQQTLSVNGKHKNINKNDLLSIAKANKVKNADDIIEEINTVVKSWRKYAQIAAVRNDLVEEIGRNLNSLSSKSSNK